tara:strand:+ start:713 stop:889 length:177 start_codon:yes stop_codon:yes gene_type:complete
MATSPSVHLIERPTNGSVEAPDLIFSEHARLTERGQVDSPKNFVNQKVPEPSHPALVQ